MNNNRYVARAESGTGWRVYNRKTNRPWGNYFRDYPDALLAELNGPKRPERLTELARCSYTKKS